ncbi:hypothetical protein BG003_008981 [Podila horticola]|nr:hypothetical protein BG003_008981 [Podila horticola]
MNKFKIALGHSKPSKITAGKYSGKYSAAVNVAINPNFPSSSISTYGWMTYSQLASQAPQHKRGPRGRRLGHQHVPAQIRARRFNGTFDKVVPYICVILSEVLYLARKVPVPFKAFPTLNDGAPLTVVSVIVKLKQYTSLKASFETEHDSKDMMNIAMNDG